MYLFNPVHECSINHRIERKKNSSLNKNIFAESMTNLKHRFQTSNTINPSDKDVLCPGLS